MPRAAIALALLSSLVVGSGAGCPRMMAPYMQRAPRLLPQGANLDQIVNVVNGNSQRVHSLVAPRATIRAAGIPTLQAQIALERPRRFRLVASFMGPAVDMGSNHEVFWVWNRAQDPTVILFARHDEFARSPGRDVFPIEPDWLSEALGVVEFDPVDEHLGPVAETSDRVRIMTNRRGLAGDLRRVVVIDAASGWVLEQHLYRGQRHIASSRASGHRLDPVSGAYLPQYVKIDWLLAGGPSPVQLDIDLGQVQVNQTSVNTPERWAMPSNIDGTQYVDLARVGQFAERRPSRAVR